MFLRNERSLGVKNGTVGRIEAVSTTTMSVRLDDGREVDFNLKDYADLDHGYAATIHKSQGVTVDRVQTVLYVIEEGTNNVAALHFDAATGAISAIGSQPTGIQPTALSGQPSGKFVYTTNADPAALAVAIARGGFEYQGQKCSAASRVYIPRSLWAEVKERTTAIIDELKVGDITDFRNFMGAVIDKKAFTKISEYLDEAKRNATVVAGGIADGRDGYFIHPTLVETSDPSHRLLCEEIFGPVVTVHVYDDAKWTETLRVIDATSPYALTGAVFADDRSAVREAMLALRNAAGNFYVNDKPTGAVVGQQPFGGARASGTNDKAGSKLNLMRWVSARSIKETFSPPSDYRYPFMAEK